MILLSVRQSFIDGFKKEAQQEKSVINQRDLAEAAGESVLEEAGAAVLGSEAARQFGRSRYMPDMPPYLKGTGGRLAGRFGGAVAANILMKGLINSLSDNNARKR